MKPLLPHVIAIAAFSIFTELAVNGQAGLGAAAATSPAKSAEPSPAAEAKEKAEDAALLQQLDSDVQYKAEPRARGRADRGMGNFQVTPMPPAGIPVPMRTQNVFTRQGNSTRALVVRTSEPDPKGQTNLEEDLAVMSHIFNKALEDVPGAAVNGNKPMGIDVFLNFSASPLRTLYIENYGALFFLGVNFPLLAPAEKHVEEKPVGDSAWEDARQELYGQRAGGLGEPGEGYSQEKVDKLRETLFEALKNATNIRGLKPDDFLTVWVCGGNSAGGKVRMVKNKGADGANVMVADAPISQARRTVLTIRVRKSQVDDYAKGKISLEEFEKRAQLTAYTGDSAGPAGDALLTGGGYVGRTKF